MTKSEYVNYWATIADKDWAAVGQSKHSKYG